MDQVHQPLHLNLDARLLEHFAHHGSSRVLVRFLVAGRDRPLPLEGLYRPPDEEHGASRVEDQTGGGAGRVLVENEATLGAARSLAPPDFP